MTASVESCVAAIVDGEVHRFAEIVRQFDDRVRHIIKQKVRDPATCEDMVQETFYRAFTQLDTLKDATQFESWLMVIARNCVNDHFRKKQRQESLDRTIRENRTTHQGQAGDQSWQNSDWIWHEVNRLPKQLAEVLHLRYRQNMSYMEIAEHLNLKEPTTRGRIFEARKALRQRLTDKKLFP